MNSSTGTLGFKIAECARSFGANVDLVAGPVAHECSKKINRINVRSAREMHTETLKICKAKNISIFFCVAAIADWKPKIFSVEKLKKGVSNLNNIEWVENTDTLAAVAALPSSSKPYTVGFSAETDNPSNCLVEINKKRINKNVLPTIKILDSRKQKGLISDKLQQEIKSNISNNLQTLLFLNKRGYAPFVICKKCGVTKTCNNCSSSLTLHEFAEKQKSYLLCHYCNHKEYFDDSCKSCNSINSLIFPGYGVEKVFEEVSNLFPEAKISLLSSDKVKNKSLSKEIKDITENRVQIVIGTQIISKGHNFPFLKTVGILNIDSILNDFDFRSSEKAFQQITQVAGRAGRKDLKGEVFIQTYQPNHPVIKSSINSDYEWFVNYELHERRKNFLPPFSSFISIIINSANENKAKNYGLNLRNSIEEAFPNIVLFGPSPSIIFKQNKIFRFRMLFKLKKNSKSGTIFKNFLTNIITPNGIKIYIDVDPINFT